MHGVRGDERALDGEPSGVGAWVERDDVAELLDDSGEHQWPSWAGGVTSAVIRASLPSTVMSVGLSRSAWSIVVIPRSAIVCRPRPSRTGAT